MASIPLRAFAVAALFLSVSTVEMVAHIEEREHALVERYEDRRAVSDDVIAEFVRATRQVPFAFSTPSRFDVTVTHRAPDAVGAPPALVLPGRMSAERQSVPSRSRRTLRVWERDTEV